jgi:KDO2-lipid IV(A) lauroyltransferase
MNFILAFIFILVVLILGLFSFFLINQLSNLVHFFIYRVFGYRKNVIVENLTKCFPDKNDLEIKKLLPSIYRNLTDNVLEGLKAFTMTRKQIVKRHKLLNPEILQDFFESGQSLIAVAGHYCNWEWGSLSASLQTDYNIIGLYKPLNNKLINKFIHKSRSKFGTFLAPISETYATFNELKDTP